MFHKEQSRSWHWLRLLGVVTLLALGLWLVGSQAAAAQDGPTPYRPAFERPPITAPRGPSVESGSRAAQALDGGPASLMGQPQINPGFTLDLTYDALWGLVSPGDLVTATRTSDGAYAAAEADGAGFFWSYFWLDNGQPADIVAGDTVGVYVNGALAATLTPLAISGGVDVLADDVSGNVAGLGAGTAVTVTLGEFGWMPTDEPQVVTTVDALGDFTADLTGIADLGPYSSAQVQYRDGNGHTIQDELYPSEVFRVANWQAVQGYATPGSAVTVTVYINYPGDVRWSQTVGASTPQGFYGAYDNIEYGDVVEVDLGGGIVLSTTANYLEIWPDAAADQIDGSADVAVGTPVRGYILDQFEGFYAEATDTVDGSGNFNLTFAADLRTGHWPMVAYIDAEGDEVGYSAPPPHLRAYPLWTGIYAVADAPNQPVTYTVNTGSELWTQYGWCDRLNTCEWAYFDSLEPGYVITAEFPGGLNVMEVADVSMEPDTAGDGVSGEANIPGHLDVTICQWSSGPINGCGVGATTASSPYAIAFPGFDVRDGMQLYIYHYDAIDGNRTFATRGTMETAYFEVYPWGVRGVPPQADEHVTAYLYDTDGTTLLAWTDNDGDGDPWGFWFGDWQGYGIEPGYWVTVTADSGWAAGLQVPGMSVEADAATDLIWGDAPKSTIRVEYGRDDDWNNQAVPVDGYALDVAYYGHDIQSGDWVNATYQHPNGNRVRAERALGELFRAEFFFELNNNTSMWGEAQAGSTVTVTTPLTQVYAYADPGCGGCWDVYVGQLYPGDNVSVVASPGDDPVNLIVPDPFSAEADSGSGDVWGQIGGWVSQTVEVHGWWDNGYQEVTTDLAGNYLAHYDNMPRGAEGYVRFVDQYNYTQVIFHRRFHAPDLIMSVNYGHDWVEGNYEPGHTLWLTVTDEMGVVQATVELQTQEIPWWDGGQTGFSTNVDEAVWVPSRPDILEDWWVYGRMDNGYTSEVKMGTIEGALDLVGDSISGNIYAAWFTETLNGDCGVWEDGGPGESFQVDPDGGAYACNFGAMGWNLLPGHDVGVSYQEPDGDWVINVFEEPAPNVRIEKWTEGSGQVMTGGPVVFTLRYRNDGDAEAATIYLTDTLPLSTTYVSDSSGVAPTVGAGWVAWTLGPLGPGEEAQFQLVLTNTANPGDTLLNQADIWTLYDDDPDNNHAEAEAYVAIDSEVPDLYVNKNPSPGDPAPGQTMLWEIDYGNNGEVASGPVTLVDMLPDDTSIVDWFSENGYNLWVNQSTAGEFILEAPTVPGNWGDRIYLRLLVDGGVPVGTQLTNTVEITTAHDSDPGNNWHLRDDVWVGDPRWDGSVDKNFGWGQLVPGGEVEYNLDVRNNGNVAVHTQFTDTLPAGTSFDQSWSCNGPTCVPFPPDYVDDQVAVWDLGVMEPGAWINLNVRVDIYGEVEPGTIFTNCAEVVIDGDDGWPHDNVDCVVEAVYDYGPNLRIDKYYRWNWEGQLEYTIDFKNVGSTTLYDVEITDTLPDDTSFNGNWWHWFWEGIDFNQVGNQLVWTIGRLDTTWSSGLRYQVDIDGDLIGVEGLCFVNAAEAPIPDDVWPADNFDEVAACTGPDVYIEKWIGGGEPRPGEILTFTVEFGNESQWPWDGDHDYDSHITETLPTGMTFITATAPWNPDDVWHPEIIDGNTIVWGWGPMWANNRWQFDLVVELDGDLVGGDVLINTVEARGDSPDDVEPDDTNNIFELPVTVLAPVFEVSKAYETTGLTGDVVTYTLTVINTGNAEATNVVLKDTLPAGLTYGGGGAFDGTDVTWTIASISAAGGTADVTFWATLPDEEGTITNDAYRVVDCDQGVDSLSGPPVSFDVTSANHYIYLPIVIKND